MIEFRTPKSVQEIADVCSQIDEAFGEQYHPSLTLLKTLTEKQPSQIIAAFEDNKLIGHSFVLPLSDSGKEFFFDPDLPESALSLEHLVLDPSREERVHFFVYSIVALRKNIAFSMIKYLVGAVATMLPYCHPESTFFAEVVSQDGKNLAGKLGLKYFHTYVFEGEEEVFIYQNKALESIKAFSKYDPSLIGPFESLASRDNQLM